MVDGGVRNADRLIAEATHHMGSRRRVRVIYASIVDRCTMEAVREVVPGKAMMADRRLGRRGAADRQHPAMTRNFDVLVVGSGIAGLSFALKVAARGHRVAILTKKTSAESNTNRAQGGIAVVMSDTDDFESHVRDTLAAGDGLCDETVVREIVRDGPARVQELVDIGLRFSRDKEGNYDLGREGGHSRRRILHVKDMTGKAIEEALLRAVARESPDRAVRALLCH